MSTSSCTPKEPFIKLQENGQASILNYSLPQNTSYNATAFLNLDIPLDWFKPIEIDNFWKDLQELPLHELEALVLRDIQNAGSVGIFDNVELINRENVAIVNLELIPEELEARSSVSETEKPSLFPIDRTFNFEDTGQNTVNIPNPITPQLPNNPTSPSTGTPVYVPTPIVRAFIPVKYVTRMIKDGFRPILVSNSTGNKISTQFVAIEEPEELLPSIMIALEMKMSSYLGDYGAGKTIKTFSLLPGERTTITIRTYQQEQVTKMLAQNVLDSYSESSAEDLQNTIQNEVGHATNKSVQEINTKTKNWKAGGSFGLNLGVFKIGGGGGGGGTSSETTTVNNAVETQVKMLTGATSHHVAKSDSLRQIEINSETSSTSINEYEETIVRELENINKSRVLNFVFRQLLQEFVSITHLVDVSFVFYGGLENRKSARLANLHDFLDEVMRDREFVEMAKRMIYTQLCSIRDYEGNTVGLIEKVTEELNNCIDPLPEPEIIEYVRVKKGLSQVYEGRKVEGIILDVTNRILRTPSLVVDALLGQGESLDCYNQKLQEADALNSELQNQKLQQAIQTIEQISEPGERAKLYKKVFSECCDVPQSGCNCKHD
ncbi:MAG TPA: hypothetical protein PL018_15290 [Ignavibacteriaceae bacterium]|nr:hypothetical protein [Ignavibacteriaceae bacterium]